MIIAPTQGECRAITCAVRKAMQEKGLLSDSEHSVTRLQRLNLADSQQRDVVTYEPRQIVEFHRIAKGAARGGVQEKLGSMEEQSDLIFRFWAGGDWWGFPFFSLSASRYFGENETLCLYWPLATVVIAGPKVLDSKSVHTCEKTSSRFSNLLLEFNVVPLMGTRFFVGI